MKKVAMIVLLGGLAVSSLVCLPKSAQEEQLKVCALCGALAVAQESFSYPFICRACLVARMKGILKPHAPTSIATEDGTSAIVPMHLPKLQHAGAAATDFAIVPRHLSYADTAEEGASLSSAAGGGKKDPFNHILTFDRFQSVARRTKQTVLVRPERTGQERKNKDAFKRSIEEEAHMSREHMWSYLVAQDHTFVTVQSALLPHPYREKAYFTRKPFTKMLYRNGCAVFVLPTEYEVHDFSCNKTMFFPFAKKDELEHYLYKNGHGGQFKEYVVTVPSDGKKMKSTGLIPTLRYALTDDRRTVLVGNDGGYILKWELGAPVEDVFARADEVAVVADGHHFVQDFSRHEEEEEVTVRDYPLDVLVVEKAQPRDLMEQGFVRVGAPEMTVDMFMRDLASVPDSCTYMIYQPSTLEELAVHLRRSQEPSGGKRKFSYSLTIEQDEETQEQEAVIKVIGNVLLDNGCEDAWKEEIVLYSLQDRAWYRDGQVVTWDHEDLISFDYENKEAKRFVLPEGVTRDNVAAKMPELAFTELRQAGA